MLLTSFFNFVTDVAQFDSAEDKTYKGDRHVWTLSHVYSVGDTYTVTMDFENWVSSYSTNFTFHLMEEIADCQ